MQNSKELNLCVYVHPEHWAHSISLSFEMLVQFIYDSLMLKRCNSSA